MMKTLLKMADQFYFPVTLSSGPVTMFALYSLVLLANRCFNVLVIVLLAKLLRDFFSFNRSRIVVNSDQTTEARWCLRQERVSSSWN